MVAVSGSISWTVSFEFDFTNTSVARETIVVISIKIVAHFREMTLKV